MSTRFQAVSIADYEEEALKVMGGDAIAYYNSGSDGEETLKENRFSSTRYRIRPRIMRGISHVDMTSSILGHSISFPVCAAPSAWHRFANLKGELETAKGVTSAGVVMNLSSVATVRTEEVTSSFPDGLFFMQCYCLGNKRLQELMLREAKRQGFKAIVLSVDCSVISKRRKQFGPSMLERINSEMLPINYMQNEESSRRAEEKGPAAFFEYYINMAHGATPVGLDFIRWIKDTSELPVITKGILTGKAAREAVEHGADAVWISNHGGRQLDFSPSTLDVLTEVVDALKGTNTEIYIDSGFRSGSDVFKALALGARAVFLGRPILWGLAVRGSDGVRDVLDIIKEELRLCMMLSGEKVIISYNYIRMDELSETSQEDADS